MRLRHWLVVALIVVLAAAGLQTLHTVRHFMHAYRASEPLRPWMSIPYIAHSHRVPTHVLYQALGLPADRHDHRPIGRIARQQGKPVGALIEDLQNAIAQARSGQNPHPHRGAP